MRLIRRRRHEEQGSAVIIAIVLITMSVVLSVAVVARTSNGISSARNNQDYAGALTQADAGVSDALFRLDQLGGSASTAAFCVGAPSCTVADVPGAPGAQYKVTPAPGDPNTVTVTSKGVDNGVPHAVEAQVVRQQEFPFALFAKTALSFQGNVDGPSCTQAAMPCQGIYQVTGDPAQVSPAGASVATNGSVTCTGNGSPATKQSRFPGGTNNKCPNSDVLTGSYNPLDPVSSCPVLPNVPPTPCLPAAGSYTALDAATCDNMPAIIPAGVYLCTSHLSFRQDLALVAGGKVQIFVLPPSGGTADVTLSRPTGGAPVLVNKAGDPTMFRINMAGSGKIEARSGSTGGDFTGIIYAPSSAVSSNICRINIRGAIVVNTYNCAGAPHLQLQYDRRVALLLQANWSVRNFREIPSASVVIP